MDIDTSAEEFYTAIRAGDLSWVRGLLDENPALLASSDRTGASPALVAMYSGHRALADELAARQPELTVFEAVAFDDTTKLLELLETDKGQLEVWSGDGWQPLHLAAMFGRSEAARALLDADAPVDVSARNDAAAQPLNLAASGGHSELVWVLIASDASVDYAGTDGRTPLMQAAVAGDLESVRALLAAGADPSLSGPDGVVAAELAATTELRDLLS